MRGHWDVYTYGKIRLRYINQLLKVGFDTLDFGSFVSPKPFLKWGTRRSLVKTQPLPQQLLAIVANVRGARDAASFDEIAYLGYPFSISETFQMRNTNTIEESVEVLDEIIELCEQKGKELVVYLSMGLAILMAMYGM